jgi:proline dehydrogenase
MTLAYQRHVADLSRRYGVPIDQIERRVNSRRERVHGLLGTGLLARSVGLSLALGAAEERLVRRLAAGARHVNGLDEESALEAARTEALAGRFSTLGYWARPGETPASIARHHVRAVEAIADAQLDASISIKADLLDYDGALLGDILGAAKACGVRVHFDGQGYDTVARTHDLVERAVMAGADVSATLASRFLRSVVDAERFVRLRVPVRLVKGQGGDPGDPKLDPRRGFLDLVEVLAGRARHVGVATHDLRTARPALERLRASGTSCSLEQMRSLPRLDFLADEFDIPERVYVAYGHAGLPYAIREVLRRPAIAAWLLRDLLARRHGLSQS